VNLGVPKEKEGVSSWGEEGGRIVGGGGPRFPIREKKHGGEKGRRPRGSRMGPFSLREKFFSAEKGGQIKTFYETTRGGGKHFACRIRRGPRRWERKKMCLKQQKCLPGDGTHGVVHTKTLKKRSRLSLRWGGESPFLDPKRKIYREVLPSLGTAAAIDAKQASARTD